MATFTPDLLEWKPEQLEALATWLDGYMIPGIPEEEWDEIWEMEVILPTEDEVPCEDYELPRDIIPHFAIQTYDLGFLVFTWDGKLTDTEAFMVEEAVRYCEVHWRTRSRSYHSQGDFSVVEHYECGCYVIRPDSIALEPNIGV